MIEYERSYDQTDEEALERLKLLADYWSAKWGFAPTWDGGTARFDGRVVGVRFRGTVEIGRGRVHARMNAGFLAEKLGGRAYVSRKVDDYLDPANSIASLRARIER
ncbi:MAG: polyhydroxyalkanoic acid system family protein [Myxococcota bacterium]